MGEMLFNFRKSKGFPVDMGPRAVVETPIKRSDTPVTKTDPSSPYDRYAVYMQVTRDDLCLKEVCRRMFERKA
jgi:hypothetical protein